MTAETRQSPARRFRLSFSLRLLLAFIFVCAAAAAVWAQFVAPKLSAERQRRIHAQLQERGIARWGHKALNVHRIQLTADDVALMSESGELLAIQWGSCTDETLRQLSQLKQLELLDLQFAREANYPDDIKAGTKRLADFPNLRALRLYTFGTKEEMRLLASLHQLELLSLHPWTNDPVLEGAEDWDELRKLHTLELRFMRMSDDGLRHLARLPELKSLTFLYCSGLSDEGLRSLGAMDQLKELNFLNCQDLTDEGLRHLGGLKNLESLSLVCGPGYERTDYKHDERGSPVSKSRVTIGASQHYYGDEGFRYLGGLSKLKNLCVYSPRLTKEVFVTARKLPNLSLLYLGLCPANGMLPGEEMARWLDTVYPWPVEQKVNALVHPLKFECEDASLEEFVRVLQKAGVPAVVKFSDLERANRLPVAPITAAGKPGVTLRESLNEILTPRELGWVISSDGRNIAITTIEAAESENNRVGELEQLRESRKGEVLRADTWGRRADAYSIPVMFNEYTFDTYELEIRRRREN